MGGGQAVLKGGGRRGSGMKISKIWFRDSGRPKFSNSSAGPLALNFCEPLKSLHMAQWHLLEWFYSLGQMPEAELQTITEEHKI